MHNFLKKAPVTCAIIAFCLVVFGVIHSNFFPDYTFLTVPGVWHIGTFLAHFSHYEPLHMAMNMFMLAQLGAILEQKLKGRFYFLVLISIWLGLVSISYPFLKNPSLGFSGIMMGLLAFSILEFYQYKSFSKPLITLLGINIAIGFLPGISLLMHFLGAVVGALIWGIYYLTSKLHR